MRKSLLDVRARVCSLFPLLVLISSDSISILFFQVKKMRLSYVTAFLLIALTESFASDVEMAAITGTLNVPSMYRDSLEVVLQSARGSVIQAAPVTLLKYFEFHVPPGQYVVALKLTEKGLPRGISIDEAASTMAKPATTTAGNVQSVGELSAVFVTVDPKAPPLSASWLSALVTTVCIGGLIAFRQEIIRLLEAISLGPKRTVIYQQR